MLRMGSILADKGDTIAALATAPGEGGIAIIRISGPEALTIAHRVFRPDRPPSSGALEGYRAYYGRVVDPDSGETLDEAIALVMRAPLSYTREDVAELHCHGGTAVLDRVLVTVLRNGARLAEPGEFTFRAFMNGRLDLAQAEAVIDLIRSRSDLARKAAMDQLSGMLSRRVSGLRRSLIRYLAHAEALVDFPEDEVPGWAPEDMAQLLGQAEAELGELMDTYQQGRVLREGLRAALVGRPNVGKSSLLNALAGADRALVTEVPGTTRDVIEETISAGGVPVTLLDTAGIRATVDRVESLGVERSLRSIELADIILHVLDDSGELTDEDERVTRLLPTHKVVVVINKVDTGVRGLDRDRLPALYPGRPLVEVSATEGKGMNELRHVLRSTVLAGGAPQREGLMVTRARHRDALERAATAVRQAADAVRRGLSPDLVAIDLREAAAALGEITGETVGEEVLQTIFAEFCLGK